MRLISLNKIYIFQKMEGPFVINLDHRTDRLEKVQNEFKKMGIVCTRWPATHNVERGWLGCLKSHTFILRAHFDSDKPLWICEDDAEFLCNRETLLTYIANFLESPAEALCLGFSSYAHIYYSDLFFRSTSCQTASCYIIKPPIIKRLCLLFESVIACIEKGEKHPEEEVYKTLVHAPDFYCADQCWKLLQQDSIWLIPNQRLVRQAAGYSDIEKMTVFYGV